MKALLTAITSLSLICAIHADEAISLFNGKDLTGWKAEYQKSDQGKDYWSVKDGAITVDTKGDKKHLYVWLVHEKEFADFDLSLKIKELRPAGGNSGIQIRSRYSPHPKGKGMWMNGPQIDIHTPTPYRIGLIYDETFETQHWIHPVKPSWKVNPEDTKHQVAWKKDGWNTLRIKAVGTKIQTWLNGNLVSDYDGEGVLNDEHHKKHHVGMKGHIALQLHARDDLALQFKDITIKEIK
ncbi:hypothetical protein Rhal01_01012 [Rubritalea halochordaticola]|uniref:3-keto-alpha-glucoside-1,2-lyase/3-keto-2-hydroxy-glucal hydratase domain-containing protein n=1 Tax=Rubritalea halochordaticola TaxID=714537 RepID=A0ABP9UX92_9BACT